MDSLYSGFGQAPRHSPGGFNIIFNDQNTHEPPGRIDRLARVSPDQPKDHLAILIRTNRVRPSR
jgi:hypothetical protein